jgi:hypothetical protein
MKNYKKHLRRHFLLFVVLLIHITCIHGQVFGKWVQKIYSNKKPIFQDSTVVFLQSEGDTVMYAGVSGGGVFRSINGEIWKPMNNGLKELSLINLTRQGNKYYLTTLSGGIYSRTIGVNTWQLINKGLEKRQIYDLSTNTKLITAATDRGLYISRDEGKNWIKKKLSTSNAPSATVVLSVKVENDRIVAGGNEYVYTSVDSGEKWVSDSITQYSVIKTQIFGQTNILGTSGEGIFEKKYTEAKWQYSMANDSKNIHKCVNSIFIYKNQVYIVGKMFSKNNIDLADKFQYKDQLSAGAVFRDNLFLGTYNRGIWKLEGTSTNMDLVKVTPEKLDLLISERHPITDFSISISPNPSFSEAKIHFVLPESTKTTRLLLISGFGSIISEYPISRQRGSIAYEQVINVSNLNTGIYYLFLYADEKILIEKLLISK